MGYIEETGVAQHFRDSRIAPIYEGTNGIQAMDLVGRKLGLRGGAAMRAFIDAIRSTAAEADAAGGALAEIGAQLADAATTLGEATEWLLASAPRDPNNAFAAATPYLRMAGIVTEAWVLTRAAIAAAALRAADGGGFPDEFLEQKLVTARFFARQLLPEAASLLPAVTAGPADLFDARF
jgi:3-(methylthio)propanoyl-CoA dehydrogenase